MTSRAFTPEQDRGEEMNKFKIWFRVPDPSGSDNLTLIIHYAFINANNMGALTRQLKTELGLYVDFWFVPWHQIILIEEWEDGKTQDTA